MLRRILALIAPGDAHRARGIGVEIRVLPTLRTRMFIADD
jgi:hypothetical protein